jgi:DNA-binding transcriptional ArsR family regulator
MADETTAGENARDDREATHSEETTDEERDWSVLGYVDASTYRTDVLHSLAEGPATPKRLAETVGAEITHVSRALQELRDRDLVELLVPEARRKGRVYGATDKGERVATHLKDWKSTDGGVEA